MLTTQDLNRRGADHRPDGATGFTTIALKGDS
jgi:hypothetical protein